ncbi:MAG: ABC transporter permease [Chloroflexota bacterium]|nr:ABC transporter permease [Chloroflexota bacterium]
MRAYLVRRFLFMVVGWWLLSVVVFIVIQLPPGDFLTNYIAGQEQAGTFLEREEIESLKLYYGLDRTPIEQYFYWAGRFVVGDLGRSFGSWRSAEQPVTKILAEVLPFTVILSTLALIFTFAVAIPIGIYSATHQYRPGDYFFTAVGFIGLAVPNFMLALLLMYMLFKYFDITAGGLFSPEYALADWSVEKVIDMLQHLVVPVVVLGTAGTASTMRVMRGVLLDELGKQYVITARARGVSERKLLFKYPVRLALNPIVSSTAYILPGIFGGNAIVAIVLSLPMTGPVLLTALRAQDMFLAGSIVMVEGALVIFGTFLSDILLALVDPRIRQERAVAA